MSSDLSSFASSRRLWPPARRDPAALGFGVAFLFLGVAGLSQAFRLGFSASWLPPLLLVALGVAGLVGVLLPRWRRGDIPPPGRRSSSGAAHEEL